VCVFSSPPESKGEILDVLASYPIISVFTVVFLDG